MIDIITSDGICGTGNIKSFADTSSRCRHSVECDMEPYSMAPKYSDTWILPLWLSYRCICPYCNNESKISRREAKEILSQFEGF